MKNEHLKALQPDRLVYELIKLCKKRDLWDGMFIALGDKCYYADNSSKASGFREISDVDIRKPPYEFGFNEKVILWISGGVFTELVYMPYDYAGEEMSEECINYLLEHDKIFKQQYEWELNDLLEMDLEMSSFPDDTEFYDYEEYLEYREEYKEELREEIKNEMYFSRRYITADTELLRELEALADRYGLELDPCCRYDLFLVLK